MILPTEAMFLCIESTNPVHSICQLLQKQSFLPASSALRSEPQTTAGVSELVSTHLRILPHLPLCGGSPLLSSSKSLSPEFRNNNAQKKNLVLPCLCWVELQLGAMSSDFVWSILILQVAFCISIALVCLANKKNYGGCYLSYINVSSKGEGSERQ